jgi:FtsP/CotA-like multicopper oxidase with cupredoxin domain
VALEARTAGWRPDPTVDSAVTVRVFAESGRAAQVPGPLIRVHQGTRIDVVLRNRFTDSTLVVHGLGPAGDTVQVAPGAVRTISFSADSVGTFLYWGSTAHAPINQRWGRDAQLNGLLVVDPRGAARDSAERIFVLSMVDIYPDPARPPTKEDIWEVAINGLSWPHTERFQYAVGDSVRWRWVNATFRGHPMHLHGFHFQVTAKGSGSTDTLYAADRQRLGVTELMAPGSTFRMTWVPTRAGSWLMHCHMIPHITPFPARADSVRGHDVHDVTVHPTSSMAGLVIGITTIDPHGRAASRPGSATRRLRLLAQERSTAGRRTARGFVLQEGAEPAADSLVPPSVPLVLVRGETTEITVVNRQATHTTVHWHGMELESQYDGVAGWSGADAVRAPLVARGDSFAVRFTPPRAGTFIYHTHMDEEDQLAAGMYGPMIVLEPGEAWNPGRDLIVLFGLVPNSVAREDTVAYAGAINGELRPAPRLLVAGTTYRIRLINMHQVVPMVASLTAGNTPVVWRSVSKDGADLPPTLRRDRPARIRIGVGETYDFEWTPAAAGTFVLDLALPDGLPPVGQEWQVR